MGLDREEPRGVDGAAYSHPPKLNRRRARPPEPEQVINVAWIAVVAMAGSLLAAFRHLALPCGDLRKASIKTLRFRLFEIPGRITHGQRKTWLHLSAAWPWTQALTTAWQTIKTLPIPI